MSKFFSSNRISASLALFGAAAMSITAIGSAQAAPPNAPKLPFSASMSLVGGALPSAGPVKGELVITNITLTNFDTSPQQVFIFAPTFKSGGHCGDQLNGGATPRMQVYVQPSSTLVIPYPTGLVITGLTPNCIAAEVTTVLHGGSVEMDVAGFSQ